MQTKIYDDCATDNMCIILLFPGPLRLSQSKESGFDFSILPPCFHDYSSELRDFKMAVARTRAMVSESFDSYVAPVINKPVPNHLLETSKCII